MKRICNIALTIILVCGCDSFLDVTPKGKLLPEKVQDFDEMIGDSRNPSSINPLAEMCGDNLYMTEERLTGKSLHVAGRILSSGRGRCDMEQCLRDYLHVQSGITGNSQSKGGIRC